MWNTVVMACLNLLSKHLPGVPEDANDNGKDFLVLGPKVESGAFQI
jgi:hypothetical protein